MLPGSYANPVPFGNEFTDRRVVPSLRIVSFTFSDLVSGVFSVPQEKGEIVLGVGLEITAAFTGATAVIVGDSDDDNGYIATGVVDPTVAGSFFMGLGGTADLAGGKKYAALASIKATFSTSTAISAGTGKLMIWSFKTAGDWRVPDL